MTTTKPDYKKLNAELDEVLERLQSTDITVDEAVAAYEKGQKLITQIEEYLEAAELKITKLQTK